MINYKDIDVQLLARLDANGTDAYDLNFTRIPAVNGAQYLVQGAVTPLLEKNKNVGESLRDLNLTAVFQTSQYKQVDLDQILSSSVLDTLGRHKLWSVIGVYPEFVSSTAQAVNPDPIDTRSIIRQDVRFIRPLKAAAHYTQEETAAVDRDIFANGNRFITDAKAQWGYTFGSRTVTNVGQTPQTTITLVGGPGTGRRLVAISYLKVPDRVPQMPLEEQDPIYSGLQLEWPESMAELLISVALRMMMYKQGDGTTVNSLTTEEMSMLITALA